MMKKIIFFILLLSLRVSAETSNDITRANTCSVELFSKVYRLESNQALTSTDIILKTTCDTLISNKISQLISNSSGTVGAATSVVAPDHLPASRRTQKL